MLANAERGPNTIVVLSLTDPTELRRTVLDAVPDMHRTRVVYRFGDPRVRADLALARLSEARGVVVLNDDEGDVSVAQTVVALAAELGDLQGLPVVVEVDDPMTAQRLVQACGTTMHPVVTSQAIARAGAFALRQRGLSKVVNELTDFSGCDLHVTDRPEAVGLRFDEIVGMFDNARPLGFARHDGRFELNPPAESTYALGDRLVVIAHDLERVEPAERPERVRRGAPTELDTASVEEHLLVLGWNPLGLDLLSGWSAATSSASSVEVAFDPRMIEPADVVVPAARHRRPGLVRRGGVVARARSRADHDRRARLHLDRQCGRGRAYDARPHAPGTPLWPAGRAPRLVVQLLDDEHADLAVLTGPDDFLISSALGSQLIAQLIEQPERRAVLLELYGGHDASIRMIRCDRLDLIGKNTMGEIVAAAYAAGVLAIGWRHTADGAVVLNADADASVTLADDDEIVVVG